MTGIGILLTLTCGNLHGLLDRDHIRARPLDIGRLGHILDHRAHDRHLLAGVGRDRDVVHTRRSPRRRHRSRRHRIGGRKCAHSVTTGTIDVTGTFCVT